MTRILLLDADGVMVRPAGYREALRATVNYFVDSPLPLEEESLTELERRQITSEWDMAPLLIATYWNDVLSRQPMPDLPDDVNSAARYIRRQRNVDAPARVTVPEFHLQPGKYPARSAYEFGLFPQPDRPAAHGPADRLPQRPEVAYHAYPAALYAGQRTLPGNL